MTDVPPPFFHDLGPAETCRRCVQTSPVNRQPDDAEHKSWRHGYLEAVRELRWFAYNETARISRFKLTKKLGEMWEAANDD